MSDILPSRTLRVSIQCPPEQAYALMSNPERLPHWATAFCKSVRRAGDDWLVETPDGEVRVRFVKPNEFGVADHVVTLPNGKNVFVPLRVIPNGSGSEVLFTLFRHPAMTDAEFARDTILVQEDLETLKRLLEA